MLFLVTMFKVKEIFYQIENRSKHSLNIFLAVFVFCNIDIFLLFSSLLSRILSVGSVVIGSLGWWVVA